MTSDEKMMGGRLIGVVIGFLGIVIMIGTDVLAVMNTNLPAHLAILGARFPMLSQVSLAVASKQWGYRLWQQQQGR